MGWSTDLFCNITFSKETFNSKYEVEDKIQQTKDIIQLIETRLSDLATMTEPNKVLNYDSEKYNDILDQIRYEVKQQFEELQDYYFDLFRYGLLLGNWDACHNNEGLAINPPENIDWRSAFLDGDFIKSVKYPNGYE